MEARLPASFAIRAAALTLGLISVAGASAREEVTVLVAGSERPGRSRVQAAAGRVRAERRNYSCPYDPTGSSLEIETL